MTLKEEKQLKQKVEDLESSLYKITGLIARNVDKSNLNAINLKLISDLMEGTRSSENLEVFKKEITDRLDGEY